VGSLHESGSALQEYLHTLFPTHTIERFHYDRLSVDDMQEFHARAHQKGAGIFIIEIAFAQHEAQHALLKAVEEPAPGTHILFCVPQESTLIPTIQSRCVKLFNHDAFDTKELNKEDTKQDQDTDTDKEKNILSVEQFLSQTPEERLAYIKKEAESWTHEDVLLFINTLEEYFYKKNNYIYDIKDSDTDKNKKNTSLRTYEIFKQLDIFRSYLASPSASLSMIVEMIALVV
jgi:DNA polymerase III delta prime subunit